VPLTAGLTRTELVDKKGFVTQQWQTFFRDQDATVTQKVTQRLRVIQFDEPRTGNLPTTPIGTADPLKPGLYRVTAYVRVVQPAATASSVLVTLLWTDGGVDCLQTLVPAVTGNTEAATGTGTAMVRSDGNVPISIATTYVSDPAVAPGAMAYTLSVVLEDLGGN
jgi:hypothetical protein